MSTAGASSWWRDAVVYQVYIRSFADGKGFVGSHCASDTFHSAGDRNKNQEAGKQDAYIAMLGGEFISHGSQQKASSCSISITFRTRSG